jgi:hypothetical protein
MLQTFFVEELRREMNRNEIWFQQDGATTHNAGETMEMLRNLFPRHLISRFGDFNWPARSPDLSPPDLFLWGPPEEWGVSSQAAFHPGSEELDTPRNRRSKTKSSFVATCNEQFSAKIARNCKTPWRALERCHL